MSALLRLISILCTLVLIASFAIFVSDQAGSSSKKTVAQIAVNDDTANPVAQKAPTEKKKKHGGVAEKIDAANDKLVSPFTGFVGSSTGWSRHIALLVIGFLVYGLGIGFVARYAATRGV